MRDAGDELIAALRIRASADIGVVTRATTPWMSATFSGARHDITLRLDRAASAALCDGIAEAEFSLRGHFVADIAAWPVVDGVRIEALTIVAER